MNLTLHTSINLSNNTFTTPGPGRYNTNLNSISKTDKNKFKFSTDKKYHYKNNHNPGPGAYLETDINNKKHNNAVNFSKTERKSIFESKANNTVGPGRYNTNTNLIDPKKKVSIGLKPREEKKLNTPGPGAYENFKSNFSNSGSLEKNSNKGVMNSKIKRDFTIKLSDNEVGPGRYKINDSICSKKITHQFKFSDDKRFKDNVSKNPGPGQYKIPCSIRDVTGYNEVGGNFDPVFKFV